MSSIHRSSKRWREREDNVGGRCSGQGAECPIKVCSVWEVLCDEETNMTTADPNASDGLCCQDTTSPNPVVRSPSSYPPGATNAATTTNIQMEVATLATAESLQMELSQGL